MAHWVLNIYTTFGIYTYVIELTLYALLCDYMQVLHLYNFYYMYSMETDLVLLLVQVKSLECVTSIKTFKQLVKPSELLRIHANISVTVGS